LAAVEADVNDQVRGNVAVATHLMEPDAAIEAGAMALFGEKYGDEVRVVTMGHDSGNDDTAGAAGKDFSIELCGGTHVRRTGDIGLFKIVSEGAVAAGVRRIEALTGPAAVDYLTSMEAGLRDAAALLQTTPQDVPARLAGLLDERKKLDQELTAARRKLAVGGGGSDAAGEVMDVGGITLAPRLLDGMPAKDMKGLADALKGQIGSGVVALVSVTDGKASLVVGVTDDLADRVNAIDLVRAGAAVVGGKGGGGRRDMAQAGGPDGAKAAAALQAIETALGEKTLGEKTSGETA
jgi:alanyl-tRNA synthetase